MPRYRFITTDGQMFESTNTPAQIHKAHPGSRITHTIGADAVGNPTFTPYTERVAEKTPLAESGPYDGKTVAELLALAKDRGVDIPSDAKKVDIIAALVADDDADNGDGEGEG